jgi:hypothetical protein
MVATTYAPAVRGQARKSLTAVGASTADAQAMLTGAQRMDASAAVGEFQSRPIVFSRTSMSTRPPPKSPIHKLRSKLMETNNHARAGRVPRLVLGSSLCWDCEHNRASTCPHDPDRPTESCGAWFTNAVVEYGDSPRKKVAIHKLLSSENAEL